MYACVYVYIYIYILYTSIQGGLNKHFDNLRFILSLETTAITTCFKLNADHAADNFLFFVIF